MLETSPKQFDLFDPPDQAEPKLEKVKKPKHIFEIAYEINYQEYLDKDHFFPGEAELMAARVVGKLSSDYTVQREALQKAADKVHDDSALPDFFVVAKSLIPQVQELERLRAKGNFGNNKEK
jgi:hypothetical protein